MAGRHRQPQPLRRGPVKQLIALCGARWRARAEAAAAEAVSVAVPRSGGPLATTPPPPPLPPSIDQAVVPDTVADIDPATGPAELPQITFTAERACELLHAAHLNLPRSQVRWHFYDDGVLGEVFPLDATEDQRRSIVALYADALGVPVVERPREPADDGYVIVAASGTFRGVRVCVEAILGPDISGRMRIFEEASRDPSLDDPPTETFPVQLDSGPMAVGDR